MADAILSPLSAGSPSDQPSVAWAFAVEKYRQTLTPEEQQNLRLQSLDDFVSDLKTDNLTAVQKSRIKRCMDKLMPLFKTTERFEPAIETFMSADPYGVLSLIWGSIRMVFIVGKELADYYDQLIEFFQEVDDSIGRLKAYERLFSKSRRFNKSLCNVFESLLDFCDWLRTNMRSQKSRVKAKLFFSDTLKKDGALKISQFRALCIKTEGEAVLANAQASIRFQNKAEKFFDDTRKLNIESEEKSKVKLENTMLNNLHEKLSPLPMRNLLERLQRDRYSGTCAWISSTSEFSALLSDESQKSPRLTWITGAPGSGKSYLAAYLIDSLQSLGPTAYFFCDTRDQSKRTLLAILKTWAWQLLNTAPSMVGDAVRVLTASGEVTTSALLKIFSNVCQDGHMPYFLVDGLDECESDSRLDILDALKELAAEANVIIISRKENDIEKCLRQYQRRIPVVRYHISSEDTKQDLDRYIRQKVLQLELADAELVATIVERISSQAQGMFLYARLMINELDQQDTDQERLEVLLQLPEGIDAVYSKAAEKIRSIKGKRRQRVIHLLELVACAARPLTIQELQIALSISPNDEFFSASNMPDVRKLFLEFCTSLFEVVPTSATSSDETDILTIIHATAKDFLLKSSSERLVDSNSAHAYIAAVNLTYMSFPEIDFVDRSATDLSGIDPSTGRQFPFTEYLHQPFREHKEDYPFLVYSASNWIHHFLQTVNARAVNQPLEECLEAMKNLLSSERLTIQWLELLSFSNFEALEQSQSACETIDHWILEYEERKAGSPSRGTPIKQTKKSPTQASDDDEIAFLLNGLRKKHAHEDEHKDMSTRKYPSRQQLGYLGDSWGNLLSHLGLSSPKGIIRWRRFLMDPMTRPPMNIAALFDFTNFVKQELRRGVNVDMRSELDRTPLGKAAWGEALSTIKLLVKEGADINQVPLYGPCDGTTPLLHALYSNDAFEPVRSRDYSSALWMLDNGAKVENNISPLNPLHWIYSWWSDSPDEMKVLAKILDTSDDLDKLMEIPGPLHHMSSIHVVARNNLAGSMGLFLERHSNPKKLVELTWGGDAKTALHEACYHKVSKTGPLLIAAGANVNRTTACSGSTPLHIAAHRRSDMLERLLDAGAQVNALDAVGQTPLHLASARDWEKGVKILLDRGAKVDIVDAQGMNALDLAIGAECTMVPSILRAMGAKETRENDHEKEWPQCAEDVYHVAFLLKCMFRRAVPPDQWRTDTGRRRSSTSLRPVDSRSGQRDRSPSLKPESGGRSSSIPRGLLKKSRGRAGSSLFRVTSTDGVRSNKNDDDEHSVAYQDCVARLVSQIVDRAEYWLVSETEGFQTSCVMQYDSGRPYITSNPIKGCVEQPVRKLDIHVECESTVGTEPLQFPGPTSWTWFELAESHQEGQVHVMNPGPELVVNALVGDTLQVHSISKNTLLDVGDEIALWSSRLRVGESVSVLPMARWPNWMNKVLYARLAVHTSPLRSFRRDDAPARTVSFRPLWH